MPIMRGTRVVLINGAKGAIPGDEGKVSSRKKNGWLRVTIDRTHKTISVRNGVDRVGIKVVAMPKFATDKATEEDLGFEELDDNVPLATASELWNELVRRLKDQDATIVKLKTAIDMQTKIIESLKAQEHVAKIKGLQSQVEKLEKQLLVRDQILALGNNAAGQGAKARLAWYNQPLNIGVVKVWGENEEDMSSE